MHCNKLADKKKHAHISHVSTTSSSNAPVPSANLCSRCNQQQGDTGNILKTRRYSVSTQTRQMCPFQVRISALAATSSRAIQVTFSKHEDTASVLELDKCARSKCESLLSLKPAAGRYSANLCSRCNQQQGDTGNILKTRRYSVSTRTRQMCSFQVRISALAATSSRAIQVTFSKHEDTASVLELDKCARSKCESLLSLQPAAGRYSANLCSRCNQQQGDTGNILKTRRYSVSTRTRQMCPFQVRISARAATSSRAIQVTFSKHEDTASVLELDKCARSKCESLLSLQPAAGRYSANLCSRCNQQQGDTGNILKTRRYSVSTQTRQMCSFQVRISALAATSSRAIQVTFSKHEDTASVLELDKCARSKCESLLALQPAAGRYSANLCSRCNQQQGDTGNILKTRRYSVSTRTRQMCPFQVRISALAATSSRAIQVTFSKHEDTASVLELDKCARSKCESLLSLQPAAGRYSANLCSRCNQQQGDTGNILKTRRYSVSTRTRQMHGAYLEFTTCWVMWWNYHSGTASASLPPRRTGFNTGPGHSRIFARGYRAGRCRWSAGFLGVFLFPPLHSGAAPFSPHFTLTSSKPSLLKEIKPHHLGFFHFRLLPATCSCIEIVYTISAFSSGATEQEQTLHFHVPYLVLPSYFGAARARLVLPPARLLPGYQLAQYAGPAVPNLVNNPALSLPHPRRRGIHGNRETPTSAAAPVRAVQPRSSQRDGSSPAAPRQIFTILPPSLRPVLVNRNTWAHVRGAAILAIFNTRVQLPIALTRKALNPVAGRTRGDILAPSSTSCINDKVLYNLTRPAKSSHSCGYERREREKLPTCCWVKVNTPQTSGGHAPPAAGSRANAASIAHTFPASQQLVDKDFWIRSFTDTPWLGSTGCRNRLTNSNVRQVSPSAHAGNRTRLAVVGGESDCTITASLELKNTLYMAGELLGARWVCKLRSRRRQLRARTRELFAQQVRRRTRKQTDEVLQADIQQRRFSLVLCVSTTTTLFLCIGSRESTTAGCATVEQGRDASPRCNLDLATHHACRAGIGR
ncbi:hypothetical protein PR048_028804 [Dryococelus australis]|uniref:Uncharacterized protein n=1 Tax=Dryococelus australis TaxID=614101 RepID=A0ABQ9GBL5_9NEOP|nr:hypothetical protein PR048_028804 [Dryococelus australis]